MTPAQVESNLRYSGGVTVVKGMQTTYGHERGTPTAVLEGEGGSGGVQTKDWSVCIANGILTGISESVGIDVALVVNGVNAAIREIGQPNGEPDGDMLQLSLRKT